MPSATPSNAPLRSQYAGDADMAELLEVFLSELSERTERLRGLLREGRYEELRTLAHQLKGAAGGYGYPTVSAAAAALENTIRSSAPLSGEASQVKASVEELVALCARAIQGRAASV